MMTCKSVRDNRSVASLPLRPYTLFTYGLGLGPVPVLRVGYSRGRYRRGLLYYCFFTMNGASGFFAVVQKSNMLFRSEISRFNFGRITFCYKTTQMMSEYKITRYIRVCDSQLTSAPITEITKKPKKT